MADLSRAEAITKVRKLRRLATSDNAHESTLAARRAAEIMLKYKLTEQDVVEDTSAHRVITPDRPPQPRRARADSPYWTPPPPPPVIDLDDLEEMLDPGRAKRISDLKKKFQKKRRGY